MQLIFKREQVLISMEDEIMSTNDPTEVLEVEIISLGSQCNLGYKVGEKVLIKRDSVRELKTAYFKKQWRLVGSEKEIICSLQE